MPEMTQEMKDLREKEKNLEKVPQPDRKELEDASQVINDAINGLQEKLKAVNEQITAKSAGKEEHFKARDEIKAKLDEYSERIDEKEKKRMAKIQELRKSKPMVSKYAAMESGQGGGENAGVDSLKNNIEDIKKELVEVREAKKIQSQAYSTLMEARQKVMGDVPKMFEEREKINGLIREKIMERNTLRDEFNTRQRAFSAYLNEARALRAERARLEREQREKDWDERRKAEMPDEGPKALPFADDLTYLDNMLTHLKALLPKGGRGREEGGGGCR